MRKLVVVAVGLVVCFSSSAFAEPAPEGAPASEEAPAPRPARPAVAQQAAPVPASVFAPPPSTYGPPSLADHPEEAAVKKRGRLDENVALALSLGGTFGSWAVTYAALKHERESGIWIGAASLLLGPNVGHWYRGAVFTRGTGLRLVGMLATGWGFFRMALCEKSSCRDSDEIFFYGGALLFAVATVDDIVRAPLQVRAHNKRLESLSLSPMVTDRGGGLALGGRF